MAKGINLEEFKNQLDTDAQKRCIAQEKTIKDLHEVIKNNNQIIKQQETLIMQLQNRCYAQTRGILCIFCGVKNKCEARNSRGVRQGDY